MAKTSYSIGYNADGSVMTEEEAEEFHNQIATLKGEDPQTLRPRNVGVESQEASAENVKVRREQLRNSNWATQAFGLGRTFAANLTTNARRAYDKSEMKFYDTTPGGFRTINPPPQHCRHADIKRRNRNTNSRGLGRYFSEAQDDAMQVIHCRMGVAEPNSLTGFLARAYEPSAGKLARTGEGTTFIAAATDLVFSVLLLPTVPFIHGWASLKQVITQAPHNKFYYSKPAMALYYNAVNTMLLKLAVDMKLIGGSKPTQEDPKKVGTQGAVADKETYNASFKVESELSLEDRKKLAGMFPDIFDEDTGFDIRAMSTRYQRLANKDYESRKKLAEGMADPNTYRAAIQSYYTDNPLIDDPSRDYSLGKYLKAYLDGGLAASGEKANVTSAGVDKLELEEGALKDKVSEAYKSSNDSKADYGSWWGDALEFLKGELTDGSQWISITVQPTGPVSSTFGNSSEESGLASSINSASASSAAAKFNFAGGNIGDDVVSDFMEMAFGQVNSIISTAGAAIGAGAIGAMLGGGRLEIPKYWTESTATLPGGSYKVPLRAVYGNKVSIFKDIYIPQAMITCMCLPKAAGPSSYTSPFLIEIFDPGKWQSSLAIMENLSIERGVGNLGWSKEGLPLGVDLSFDIVDLTTIMSMPVTGQSFSFNDRSSYTDYLAAMANRNPMEQLTVAGKFENKKAVNKADIYSTFSASNVAAAIGDTWVGRLASAGFRAREL